MSGRSPACAGVQFAVWAPNALRVSVVGDFNRWDGRVHPMRSRGGSGVWELFVPGLEGGAIYKFEIRSSLGDLPFLKADPYAFEAELRPKSGSVVASLDGISLERRRLDALAGAARLAGRADFDLRSASGLLAARCGREQSLAYLPRTGRPTDSLRQRAGLHAHRTACR